MIIKSRQTAEVVVTSVPELSIFVMFFVSSVSQVICEWIDEKKVENEQKQNKKAIFNLIWFFLTVMDRSPLVIPNNNLPTFFDRLLCFHLRQMLEQGFPTGVPRHTRGRVKLTGVPPDFKFYGRLTLFLHLRMPTNIYLS